MDRTQYQPEDSGQTDKSKHLSSFIHIETSLEGRMAIGSMPRQGSFEAKMYLLGTPIQLRLLGKTYTNSSSQLLIATIQSNDRNRISVAQKGVDPR